MSQQELKCLRLRPHFAVVAINPDRVLIRSGLWSGQSYTLDDSAEQGLLATVMERLANGIELNDLLAELGASRREELIQLLKQLLTQHIIEPVPEQAMAVCGRAMVSGFSPQPAEERLANLIDYCAIIYGWGEIASRTAAQLGSCGIGQLIIVAENIDLPGSLSSAVVLQPDQFSSWLKSHDGPKHLVLAQDSPDLAQSRAVNELCAEHKLTWSLCTIDGSEILVGPTFIPGQTACFTCFELRLEANIVEHEAYKMYRDHYQSSHGNTSGDKHIPAVYDLAAGYLGYDLFRVFTLNHGFTQGRLLRINLNYGGFEPADVLRLPRCPSCGKFAQKRPHSALFYTLDNVIKELEV